MLPKKFCVLKTLFCFLFLSFFLFQSMTPAMAAEEESTERIRVGYMNHPGFIEKKESGEFYGYGAEYLNEISKFTDWEIEYVFAPWAEQLLMLERGELDIVPMAQHSKEREERFLFTQQAVGIIQGLLVTLPEEQNGIENNALACDGRTIGILRGSKNITLLEQYAERMGFQYIQVEYDYQSELEEALLSGAVDLIACEQMAASEGFRVLDRFASDPHYFVTNKENTALMEELDHIISQLNAYDPTYSARLFQKYYGKGATKNRPYFTKEEMEFIRSCEEITVALVPDGKPHAYTDESGNIVGIFPDVLNLISEMSQISFQYTYVPKDKSPLQFLKENPSYVAGYVMANNPGFQNEDILLTDVYYSTYSSLVARADHDNRLTLREGKHSVGTPASFQAMHLFLKENYPNLERRDYADAEAALEALENKEVDYVAYVHNKIMPNLSNPRYGDITVVADRFMENPICAIGLNTPRNELLIEIFNKCIMVISEETLTQIEAINMQNSMYHFQQSDVIHRYRDSIMIIALVVLGAIALLVTLLWIRQYKFNKEITHRAEYDMMTGLLNRETMKKRAYRMEEERAGGQCAFFLMDIDDLKRINEIRGHDAGNAAIQGIAAVLQTMFQGKGMVGRVGADEFCVIVFGFESKSILVSMLARLQNAISMTEVANKTAKVCASIGVSVGVMEKNAMNVLYRQAEEALFRVKANGKNGFAFYESPGNITLNTISTQAASLQETIPQGALTEAVEPQAEGSFPLEAESGGIVSATDNENTYRRLLNRFPNLAVYVIEEKTHRILYYNRRFKEVCPKIELGHSCRGMMFGPCQNCIVDTMGEQSMAHTIYYSDYFADEVEITASKLKWDNDIDAVAICTWPRNILTSSSSGLPSASNMDTFDYVTGGLTRSGFIHMMERMRLGGVDLTEYAVVFLNIKDFKAVNEMVGCDGGDNLLRSVYERIEKSELRPVIGARKESDHFIFLFEKQALLEERLPELLNFHWQYLDIDLFIHCRCGIFNIEDATLDAYKMIDRAKLAKKHIVDEFIKPYAIYDASMLEEYSERASAFLLFDKGMRNNEFTVYYQPVVDAKTGKVVSAEALVRRIDEDGTVVSPGRFIPILERTGYISMLDRFVAKTVRTLQYARKEAGLPMVPVSFNISQKDFYDDSLMELLLTSLESSTLPKGFVLLEITESTYTMNEEKHGEYLKRLRDLGAKILLDDFGTGYSSFGMFKNYNFDRVKLDMSFVRQLRNNEKVRVVVESIISMCHKLSIDVVAEGVETEEELSILRDMDCDYIQGYYFSKPLDEKAFLAYVERNR